MALSPSDVANVSFKHAMRGYNVDEVEDFLTEVEKELLRLTAENQRLSADLEQSRPTGSPTLGAEEGSDEGAGPAVITSAEAEPAALRILSAAQRTADTIVEEARTEADATVEEARARAAALETESSARHSQTMDALDRRRGQLEAQVEALRGFVDEYRTRLRAYLQAQLSDLEQMQSRTAPPGQAPGTPEPSQPASTPESAQTRPLPDTAQQGQPPSGVRAAGPFTPAPPLRPAARPVELADSDEGPEPG